MLVVNGTQADALAETVAQIDASGGRAVAVLGSVADATLCTRLVQTAVDTYGGIDVLSNNAGVVRDRTLFKMTEAEFDEVIAVHLRGPWACGKQAAIAMRAQGGGHIINVISNSGLSGGFGQSNYAAAKAGMMGLQRTWLLELSRVGIHCNAFWPVAQTEMTQIIFDRAARDASLQGAPPPTPVDMGFGTAAEVAQGMIWLASDAANHFNGQCITFNGRKTALWTHPEESQIAVRPNAWTHAALAAHYANITPLRQPQARLAD